MKKIKLYMALACLLFTHSAIADYIELKFPHGLSENCTIYASYWDGDNNAYTCRATFSGTKSSGSKAKYTCTGDEKIRHVMDRTSRLDLTTNNQCRVRGQNIVGEFRVKKTAGKDKSSSGTYFFKGSPEGSSKYYSHVRSYPGNFHASYGAINFAEFYGSEHIKIRFHQRYNTCLNYSAGTCWNVKKANYSTLSNNANQADDIKR